MKSLLKTAAMVLTAALSCSIFADEKVAAEGAEPGVWTQDYDAAVALAKNKDLPIMLNFTGSDWCGWCKLMDKSVFAKDEWKSWAASNIVLVQVNFPQDKSLVPEKYVQRNKELAATFDIEGYPTYIILGSDAKTELNRLGASRGITPEYFIVGIEYSLLSWKGIDRYLSAEQYKEFTQIETECAQKEREINDFYKNGLSELKAIRAKQTSTKTDEEKAALHKEFATKKASLEASFQELNEKYCVIDERRTSFLESAVEAMRKEKKEAKK